LRAHYLGDARQAQELAQQALLIAQETGQRRAARFAQRLLGHALLGLGLPTEAAIAYQQALELDQVLGYAHFALEIAADLASVAVAQGDLDQATASGAPLLRQLRHQTLPAVEEPVRVFLTCYNVLQVTVDPLAETVLKAGYDLLRQRAAQFTDDKQRSRYVENLPAHREIACLTYRRLEPAMIGRSTSVKACASRT
jgi:hypothetical protein